MTNKKKKMPSVKEVEAQLSCKATAALKTRIKEEMEEEDKPLKELLQNDEDKE